MSDHNTVTVLDDNYLKQRLDFARSRQDFAAICADQPDSVVLGHSSANVKLKSDFLDRGVGCVILQRIDDVWTRVGQEYLSAEEADNLASQWLSKQNRHLNET